MPRLFSILKAWIHALTHLIRLPLLDRRIWLLSAGRLLSQVGNGFTLFYAPIFFVNQVGLSATMVGIGIGSGSIAGIVGRIVGGSMADSPRWGRRSTLLWSAAVSALADVALAIADDFPVFLVGNLLMGVGIGLYWPATEAVVADIVTPEQRNEAFAIVRLADSLGLSLGVVFGGTLIALTGLYRLLFVIDGLSYAIFFVLIYVAIAETLSNTDRGRSFFAGWAIALRDRPLLVYAGVNILFTTYLAQVQSTLPVYFSRFVSFDGVLGLSEAMISLLFTWHIVLAALCQLPIARGLKRFGLVWALIGSALFWGLGFLLIWFTGVTTTLALGWALAGLAVMAIATDAYTPAASALVVAIAPNALRGVYLSINSLCWAVGYFIGPTLGGWVLDQDRWIIDGFWLGSALSVLGAIAILLWLDRLLSQAQKT
ncbi:MAG: MFS transporter [Synechococcales cyanobacterium K44_A2020_017]|jgi:MFS family permease|nr:MFS transporter [Synechococcales cyanobacterium K32_A2020_035]MBF2095603.1 MFS transporter [Synechococcales cyanobacterium K44_A2020_017]